MKAVRYVRIRPCKGEDMALARLVLESDGNGFIRYGDNDRLNLRRANLTVLSYREQERVLKAAPPGGWGRHLKVKEAGKARRTSHAVPEGSDTTASGLNLGAS